MALDITDMFTPKDLQLFIESVEEITRLENLRKQSHRQHRAQYLIETLRYLDQTFPIGSSCTLASIDRPVEMQQFEILEKTPLGRYLPPNKYDELKRCSSFVVKLREVEEVKEEKQDITLEAKSQENQSDQGEKQKPKFKFAKYLRTLVVKHYRRRFDSEDLESGC